MKNIDKCFEMTEALKETIQINLGYPEFNTESIAGPAHADQAARQLWFEQRVCECVCVCGGGLGVGM